MYLCVFISDLVHELCKKMEPTAAYFLFVILAMVPFRMIILPKRIGESPHVKVDANTDLQLPELKARCVECIINAAHDEWFKVNSKVTSTGIEPLFKVKPFS